MNVLIGIDLTLNILIMDSVILKRDSVKMPIIVLKSLKTRRENGAKCLKLSSDFTF